MNRLNRTQKDKILQFKNITGATDKVASDCLKAAGWNVEASLNVFYSSAHTSHSSAHSGPDRKKIEALYAQYKEPGEDLIGVDGVQKFCADLGVEPTDVVLVVISHYMRAKAMCEYSHDEFVTGLQEMGVDSVSGLKSKLPALRAELGSRSSFKDIYNYAFGWSCEKGQKCLQLELAVAMWGLLLGSGPQAWPLVDDWCDFLREKHNRALSRDTWAQLLEFAWSVCPDFSNFDENGAWPYLVDEFVEHMREKRGES